MARIEEILSGAFLAVLAALLTFAFLELVANVYLLYWANESRFTRYASLHQLQEREALGLPKYSPHRYLGFYPTPNYARGKNRHNALGYRGEEISLPKPAGLFRIVCLGGSTTYTEYVDDYRKSYPALLGAYLEEKGFENAEVVNAGGGSWSSWESLINLEMRVLDLDPDLIIIYHGINDIHARLVWPPEAYRSDNAGWRAASESSFFMPSIFEHFTLLRILMIRLGMIKSHVDFERTLDTSPDTYYASLFRKQMAEGVYPDGIFKEVSARRMLARNRPIYFDRNIRNMVSLARAHGIEVVLSSFAYSPLFPESPRVFSDEYQSAFSEHNGILREVAEDAGVLFFDFAAKFPTSKRYYTDGRHVNEDGARLKAKLFGEFLITQGAVPATR